LPTPGGPKKSLLPLERRLEGEVEVDERLHLREPGGAHGGVEPALTAELRIWRIGRSTFPFVSPTASPSPIEIHGSSVPGSVPRFGLPPMLTDVPDADARL
jgi:hypothetical protein